jgi:hypothetical protein
MSRVAISIQTLDGRKDTYLRKEVGTMNKSVILEAVGEMLTHPDAHTIGKFKPTFPKRRGAARGDEDAQLKQQVQEIAAAVT